MTAVFFRTILLYTLVVVSMRVMGKRQLGELEASELVAAVMISELAAIPLQDADAPFLSGVVPILTLVSLEILFTFIVLKSVRARRFICGKPNIIMENGVILFREMKKSRICTDELVEELRLQGVTDFAAVKYAILETSGKLSVMLAPEERPVTVRDMSLAPRNSEMPVIVVNDGRVMSQNLRIAGLEERWLEGELKTRKIRSVKEVFLMTVDKGGTVYVSLKGEKG